MIKGVPRIKVVKSMGLKKLIAKLGNSSSSSVATTNRGTSIRVTSINTSEHSRR